MEDQITTANRRTPQGFDTGEAAPSSVEPLGNSLDLIRGGQRSGPDVYRLQYGPCPKLNC